MEVPVDAFTILIEKNTLPLDQVSISVLYTHRWNILKLLLKDASKSKTLLKEKTTLLEEGASHLFGQTFHSHMIEIEGSKNQFLEVSLSKRPSTLPNRPQGGGQYFYTGKSRNRDQNKNMRFQNSTNASTRKFHHASSTSNGKYFLYDLKGSSCYQ